MNSFEHVLKGTISLISRVIELGGENTFMTRDSGTFPDKAGEAMDG